MISNKGRKTQAEKCIKSRAEGAKIEGGARGKAQI